MKLFNEILALFRRGTSGFNPLELKILHTVETQLSPTETEKLRHRIDQINLVQRIDGGREVNCYHMQGGRPVFDTSTRLIETNGEHAFAKFTFKSSRNEKFSGTMWLVDGFFFSLEFDNATEHVIDESIQELTITLEMPIGDTQLIPG